MALEKTTEVRCHFYHCISKVHLIHMVCHYRCWPWSPGWGSLSGFPTVEVTPHPLPLCCSPWKEGTVHRMITFFEFISSPINFIVIYFENSSCAKLWKCIDIVILVFSHDFKSLCISCTKPFLFPQIVCIFSLSIDQIYWKFTHFLDLF